MRESDMQEYLFNNPEVLFPGMTVEPSFREYSILGRRIDLLFTVDGVKHIVELKAVPLKREHVGQVVEYFGLMRQSFPDDKIRLILVAPKIETWRAAFLEEMGVRCVELPEIPASSSSRQILEKRARRETRRWIQREQLEREIAPGDRFLPSDICAEATPRKVALIASTVQGSLPLLSEGFPEYEIQPLRMTRASTNHFFWEHHRPSGYGDPVYERAGWWWAYTLGFQEKMPPNDVPQLAVSANNYGLDLTVNAELLPAQTELRAKAAARPDTLSRLLQTNQDLRLKTYLRFEQQPRAYHWILLDYCEPGSFDAQTILDAYRARGREYSQLRDHWIEHIEENNTHLTEKQALHLRSRNKKLNLATRLVHTVPPGDPIWERTFEDQVKELSEILTRLKPIIDFFLLGDAPPA